MCLPGKGSFFFFWNNATLCHHINPNWSSWRNFACNPIALAKSRVHHGVAPSWPTVTGILISHYCVTVQGLFKHIGRDVERLQHPSVCNWGIYDYRRALCRHLVVLAKRTPRFAHSRLRATFCSSNLSSSVSVSFASFRLAHLMLGRNKMNWKWAELTIKTIRLKASYRSKCNVQLGKMDINHGLEKQRSWESINVQVCDSSQKQSHGAAY